MIVLHRNSATALRAAALAALLAGATSAFAENPRVEFKTTMGAFTMELYPDKAPKTVANFLQYANSGFYKGTIFHRVIDNFMIQGGGFDPAMKQKETRGPVENEAGMAMRGGLRNESGTVAMARTPDPNSATAQFFINVKDNGFLDYRDPSPQGIGYTVFGRVVEGMNVVMQISRVETTTAGMQRDVPKRQIIIESVTVKPGK
jgi:peptidyl-prolyl cis-trans isomerase A (cyclophilin A)